MHTVIGVLVVVFAQLLGGAGHGEVEPASPSTEGASAEPEPEPEPEAANGPPSAEFIALYRGGQYARLVPMLEEATRSSRASPQLFAMLGASLLHLARYHEADSALTRGLSRR